MVTKARSAVPEVKAISGRTGPRSEHEHEEHSAAFLLKGATSARAGNERFEAHAGQLVLIAAGIPHECRPLDPAAWSYTLFLIEPGASRTLDEALESAETGALVIDARRTTIASLAEAGTEAPRDSVVAAVETLLGGAIATRGARANRSAASSAGKKTADTVDSRMAAIESALRASFARNTSLEELARRAGMGKYALVRAFKAAYGLSPHSYLLNLRINEAKKLLRAGLCPVEAAFSCGFCDQSHFTRAFSRRVGLCPAEYARTYKNRRSRRR
jgi:AraC-like DNA-binding protein